MNVFGPEFWKNLLNLLVWCKILVDYEIGKF